jgi:hypothetical protein
MLKRWNVYVRREGRSQYIGDVSERDETLARCAALSKYGVGDDEVAAGERCSPDPAIHPDDEFDVSLAV